MRATFATFLTLALLTAAHAARAQSTGPAGGKDGSKPATLLSYGGKTLAEWKKQLTHQDASKRSMAIMAVMQFGDETAGCVGLLIDRTKDRDVSPRAKALLALRHVAVNDSDVRRVVDALAYRINPNNEGQAVIRYEAALTLKRFHKDARAAIPALVAGTRDTGSWELRHQCAWVLWRVAADATNGPDPAAVDALMALLRSDRAYLVRLEAIQGLGGIGLPSDPLRQKAVLELLTACTNPRSPENKPLAIWAFASLVNLQGASQGKASLNKLARYLNDPDLEIRAQASQAIGSLGAKAKEKLPELIAMLKDKEDVAVQAGCLALSGVGVVDDKVVEALLEVLDHKDPATAAAAVASLYNLKAMTPRVNAKLDNMRKNAKLHIGLRNTIEQAQKDGKGKPSGK